MNVVELRQYTLHPGARDVLIDLFDREFVETQEAVGMRVVGQFRDLDDPDRFVWLREFNDMESRAEALTAFYGGPVWAAHGMAAAATMVDSDDVLLLHPVDPDGGFGLGDGVRTQAAPTSLVTATIYYFDAPVDDAFVRFFDSLVAPAAAEAGAVVAARLATEYAENTYPALPVRAGENAFVWFASFPSHEEHRDHRERLGHNAAWSREVLPDLLTRLSAPPEQLRLAPTARSLLR